VQAIAENLRRFVFPVTDVGEVVVMGGGAENETVMRGLTEALPACAVFRAEALGMSGRAVEAVAFAVLAFLTAAGRPGNLPRVTGARESRVLGCIVPGRGYRGLTHD
jgi:anhydro-N-acetylmuramic acid kinase